MNYKLLNFLIFPALVGIYYFSAQNNVESLPKMVFVDLYFFTLALVQFIGFSNNNYYKETFYFSLLLLCLIFLNISAKINFVSGTLVSVLVFYFAVYKVAMSPICLPRQEEAALIEGKKQLIHTLLFFLLQGFIALLAIGMILTETKKMNATVLNQPVFPSLIFLILFFQVIATYFMIKRIDKRIVLKLKKISWTPPFFNSKQYIFCFLLFFLLSSLSVTVFQGEWLVWLGNIGTFIFSLFVFKELWFLPPINISDAEYLGALKKTKELKWNFKLICITFICLVVCVFLLLFSSILFF